MSATETITATRSKFDRARAGQRFADVRELTRNLAAPLSAEDQQVQSMPSASPVKWHLAHTTWFFDALVLSPLGKVVGRDSFHYLFNSYYEALGNRQPRARRGLITRPSLDEIMAYRRAVDDAVMNVIATVSEDVWENLVPILELGCHHEQQHQELILMDVKHLFFCNPSRPIYYPKEPALLRIEMPDSADYRTRFEAGLHDIGADGSGFSYDNERPRHRVWSQAFGIRNNLVTCGEWLDFMDAGGYERPELWLSDGWEAVCAEGWDSPLYWTRTNSGEWRIFTLEGERPVVSTEPVCHVSYYEADAFARWAGARLPTEQEWECAALSAPFDDAFGLHPASAPETRGIAQVADAAWQWTSSAYSPYPGFKPLSGAAAEYNGKFMSGQMVLRGGACITPEGHSRPTYRNFYPPAARWAFSGVRLATDT